MTKPRSPTAPKRRSRAQAVATPAGPGLREVLPDSWQAVIDALFDESFDTGLERYRSPFVFRGTTRDWPLTPSLHRMLHAPGVIQNIERALMRSFKKYAYHEVRGDASDWKWLSIAQHHGLPTRLLDWTFSPFVALHFATDRIEDMESDGIIWMVNFIECRKSLPDPLVKVLDDQFALSFSVEMLEERFPKVRALEEMSGRVPEFPIFFEPPSLDPRIVNQFGLFSLMNRPDADLT